MSRILKAMIVLLAIAAMVAPAMAEDRLSLSGYYTLRGYSKDNMNYDDDDSDSTQYFYQRFRLGGNLAVAEGVSVIFRADIAEGTTSTATEDHDGDNIGEGGSGANDKGNIQFDQAYVKIEKEAYTLSAGQFGGGFGNAMMLDMTRSTAIKVTLNAIDLTFEYHKLYEGDAQYSDDVDLYMVVWGMNSDDVNLDVMGGFVNYPTVDGELYMGGAAVNFDLGPVRINTELDVLSGEFDDAAGDTIDTKGLQLYVDGSLPLSETFTVGGAVIYAKGYDDDDERQVTGVGYDFEPEEYGYMKTIMGGAYAGNALDPAGEDTGVVSGQLYAAFQATDTIGLKGTVVYAEPESTSDYYDSFIVAGASVRYKLAENTTVDAQYIYSQPDGKHGTADDDKMLAGCRLTVSF